jgi:prolyl oligopeptidase PreP (S9A serine peptidase family)
MRSAAAPAGGCRTTTSPRWRRTLCGAVSPGPSRIAAEGGSNGGILIANMLTRYPDRFGALFCTIPLIDTRRYTKLLAGASWIAEYGDPDKPEDWAFLQTYSAYHMAAPGHRYPPTLLATTRKDDRVHPGQDARQPAGHGATKRTSMSPLLGARLRKG